MLNQIKSKIEKKNAELRMRGLFWVLGKFFRDHIYHHQRHVFMERDLSKPHRMYNRRQDWYIRMLDERDIEEFRANFESRMKDIAKLFRDGLVGAAVFHKDVLVGFMWYATADYYEDKYNHVIKLKKGDVYQFAGYLLPHYRGSLMVLEGMKYGQEYFREQGYFKTTCVVDTDDIPILRLHFKLGFEEIGAVLHVWKIFRLRWSKLEPYEGVRYEEHSRQRKAK